MKDRTDILFGYDIAVRAVSIGWVTSDGQNRGVESISWDQKKKIKDGQRLSMAYKCVKDKTLEMASDHPAVSVYVEQPSGSFRNLPLTYMCGVVQAAAFDALFDFWQQPVQVLTLPPKSWKKDVCGHGSFGKKGFTDETYPALLKAKELGYKGNDWNEADATCIAEYGRLTISFI